MWTTWRLWAPRAIAISANHTPRSSSASPHRTLTAITSCLGAWLWCGGIAPSSVPLAHASRVGRPPPGVVLPPTWAFSRSPRARGGETASLLLLRAHERVRSDPRLSSRSPALIVARRNGARSFGTCLSFDEPRKGPRLRAVHGARRAGLIYAPRGPHLRAAAPAAQISPHQASLCTTRPK